MADMFSGVNYYEEAYFNYSFSNYSHLWVMKSNLEIAWKALLLAIVGLIAILDNSVIVFLIWRHKTLHKSYYLFVANLCISSVLLNLYSPWSFLIDSVSQFYLFGEIGCHLSSAYLIMFMLVSGFSIIVISCDRMMVVLFPFYKTKLKMRMSICLIIMTWVASISISAPLFVWKKYRRFHYDDVLSTSCTNSHEINNHQYYVFVPVFIIYIPIMITAVTYILIIFKLHRYKKKLVHESSRNMYHRNKVMKMFFIIMMIYFWSGLPFYILLLIQNGNLNFNSDTSLPPFVNRYLSYFAHLLIYVHCAINPFIYGMNNENMRRAFRTSFPYCRRKQKIYPYFIRKKSLKTTYQSRLSAPAIIENIERKKRVTINVPESNKEN